MNVRPLPPSVRGLVYFSLVDELCPLAEFRVFVVVELFAKIGRKSCEDIRGSLRTREVLGDVVRFEIYQVVRYEDELFFVVTLAGYREVVEFSVSIFGKDGI